MVRGGCRAVVMTLSDSARPCVGIKGLSCLAGGEADGSLRGIWLSFTREGRVCHRRAPCLVPTNCSLGFRLTEINTMNMAALPCRGSLHFLFGKKGALFENKA